MGRNRLVLASSSPRRKQLLEMADLSFEVITRPVDETFPVNTDIQTAVVAVARRKAMAVLEAVNDECTIIGADTVVVLNDQPIGKPKSREDAVNILTRLQGNTHRVITGVAILSGQQEICFAEVTEVIMHAISPQQIVYYIDTYKPYDKAGAYAIQEWIGVVGIKAIRGDFYNVIGLPVSSILQKIRNLQ